MNNTSVLRREALERHSNDHWKVPPFGKWLGTIVQFSILLNVKCILCMTVLWHIPCQENQKSRDNDSATTLLAKSKLEIKSKVAVVSDVFYNILSFVLPGNECISSKCLKKSLAVLRSCFTGCPSTRVMCSLSNSSAMVQYYCKYILLYHLLICYHYDRCKTIQCIVCLQVILINIDRRQQSITV